jgi:hypothetical protein
MRWAGHVARIGSGEVLYTVLVVKPAGNDHLEDAGVNGRIILKLKMGCGGMDWIYLAQDRDRWRALIK